MAALYRATVAAINAAFEEIHKAERQEPARSHFRRGLNGAASIMQRHCAAAEVAASDSSANRQPLAAVVPAPHAPLPPSAASVCKTCNGSGSVFKSGTTEGGMYYESYPNPCPGCQSVRTSAPATVTESICDSSPRPEQPEAAPTEGLGGYQKRVAAWVRLAFGEKAMADRWERIARVVEEAIELAQAEGLDDEDVYRILKRVYNRPIGLGSQEVGGLMVTLLAWAESSSTDLTAVTLTEIERIEDPATMARIRLKQEEKAAAGTAHSFNAPALTDTPAGPREGDFERLLKAADDLCFECDGVLGTRAPSIATYNRVFDVIAEIKKKVKP